VGPTVGLDVSERRKVLPLPGFESRTFNLVVTRYTYFSVSDYDDDDNDDDDDDNNNNNNNQFRSILNTQFAKPLTH